jgi:Hypoxia induced protein conserved region
MSRIIRRVRPQIAPLGQRVSPHGPGVPSDVMARQMCAQTCSKPICRAGRMRGPPPQMHSGHYTKGMHSFLVALIGILMLATLGVLIAGMVGLVREGDPRRSNRLMQWRVLLQGAAILLFVILMSLLRS